MDYRYENLNEEQKAVFEQMAAGENLFITGEAGTGKSYLTNCFIQKMKKLEKNVVVCAPTGIAAIQIGGATIHRVFRAEVGPIEPGKRVGKLREEIKAADIIVVDEISMCRFDLFDYMGRYIRQAEKKSKRKKQVIVVGDFYQLAPVMTTRDKDLLAEAWGMEPKEVSGYAFTSPAWKELGLKQVSLTQPMRQAGDPDFLYHLNRIRKGDSGSIEWFNEHACAKVQPGISVFGTNAAVNEKNDADLHAIGAAARIYKGQITGTMNAGEMPTTEELELCAGARVMSLVNDPGGHYQNGSLGTVKEMKKNHVVVEFDTGRWEKIEAFTWESIDYELVTDEKSGESKVVKNVLGSFTQLPLKIAFAITIHKSQGQTYDSMNLLPTCFSAGQLYVALSRVTGIGCLHLLKKIRPKDLITSPVVQEFMEAADSI